MTGRWLRDAAGGLPATYWYLWAGLLINRLGAFAVLFLSLYLTEARDASPARAGLVVGMYGVGGVAGTLLGGVLTDRWGRRRTLLAAHAAAAAVLVALAVSTHLGVIAALVALLGLAHSMPGPAFVAAIIDVTPADRRSRAFNLQFWAFNLGMAGASLLAGLLAEQSFLALFLVDAAATALTTAIIAWKVPETRPAHADARAAGSMLTPLRDGVFLVFVLLTFVQALLNMQNSTILPLAMAADGLGASAYGLVVAVTGALIVAGQLFVPRLIDGRDKARVLALSMAVFALGYAALAGADALWAYLLCAVVWTLGAMIAAPPNAEINSELAPALLRGRYQAVFYLVWPAAGFVAPALGGVSLQHLGGAHWLLVGLAGAAAAAGQLWAGPARARRVAATAERTGTMVR
ncbi:MFS transporter [Spirilliplanes yamanashiensis]|uniref:MFS transporter n=1 Tax=Spirilliplanes yamanashiensis TaxID=42233 RepID=A0A8J3Y3A7_9ACTN|nr:MFS transporter [Spirilliplanes yamanashiensis]MDP9814341.1 MFS family permease [Spirilliplanes yamanashiensis]GIJ00677.1 MFS transporter [Spirilliplanes yamanashiensis]